MRVNVYAEEMTERLEVISKTIDGHAFTGLRFYLELPATIPNPDRDSASPTANVQGPFMHRPGDDDSAAVTFWGKRDLRKVLRIALEKLSGHYEARELRAENDEADAAAHRFMACYEAFDSGGRGQLQYPTPHERARVRDHLASVIREAYEAGVQKSFELRGRW